ncbi:MAG: hypothetical protein KJO31_00600, partial [Gammaproteobacteria bacterium]|nr:hypothetical protein [Gammaproteobacteria bacterium]
PDVRRATPARAKKMTTPYGTTSPHVKSVSAKAAYSKAARKKLVESKAKLDGMKAAIKHAITMGNLRSSNKLEFAQEAVEARLAAAETRLELLRKSGDDAWEEHKNDLENAWEDLSHSINKLVSRIKDETS